MVSPQRINMVSKEKKKREREENSMKEGIKELEEN